MLIALYDSSYPVIRDEQPNWEALPTGYFQLDRWEMKRALTKDLPLMNGHYVHSRGIKARSGEHLLAVFSVNEVRYLYNSTLSYENVDVTRKTVWWAHLGLAHLIKKW